MERLQKVIAAAGIASRRKAEELIKAGRVSVNGEVVTELGTKVTSADKIKVDGKPIRSEEKVYYVLNKPRGVVSTATDQFKRESVVDILKDKGVKERVYPIGRLDYDTTGVLILTNDGDFANTIMHPKSKVTKTYIAKVKGIINNNDLLPLTKGIKLRDYTAQPAKVKVIERDNETNSSTVQITITEGKNHQVKDMLKAVGHPVKKLRRDAIGILTCDGLASGEFRKMTSTEVSILNKMSKGTFSKKEIRYF